MIIGGRYSFNGGNEVILERYGALLADVEAVIHAIDASRHRTKVSKEKTMMGKLLYDPGSLNEEFKDKFGARGWQAVKVPVVYDKEHYCNGHTVAPTGTRAYREMDFVKDTLGVEVQLGKYAFMAYNVCAKMTIFRNLKHIDAGIEVVPMWSLATEMSTGVSYFEQIVWDLKTRGVADIDVPVLVLGVAV